MDYNVPLKIIGVSNRLERVQKVVFIVKDNALPDLNFLTPLITLDANLLEFLYFCRILLRSILIYFCHIGSSLIGINAKLYLAPYEVLFA